MTQAPGTVSRILWHFTGGPKWDAVEDRQENTPKTEKAAYEALISILKSREVRVGQYREAAKVRVPKLRRYNSETKRFEEQKNVLVRLLSSRVCCLTDIPIAHLSYHANRYGKFAIGFHRDAAVRCKFNPVFYTLHDAEVLRFVYEGLAGLQGVDLSPFEYVVCNANLTCEHGHEAESGDLEDDIWTEAEYVQETVNVAKRSFEHFLAFVKTFDQSEFSTIYCEREWRSVETFSFTFDDVAMIVVPKGKNKTSYFRKFIEESMAIRFPRRIPVVPWEDLLEH